MKTAIVHDWFTSYMGSEKCVESFNNLYPESDIFTIADFLQSPEERKIILNNKKPFTSFIQNLPLASKFHRHYFPLFPFAVEQLDISGYELIISSSHAFAKGVISNANQLHICYCHTPIRYAWDLYHQYINESGLNKGLKGLIAKYALHKIRMWDLSTANRVDYFIANSSHVAKRIKKIYNRDAEVIYPPVDTDLFSCVSEKDDYYLIISRFVPYKKVDVVVEAFSKMPDKKLLVVGSGPDEKKIKNLASSNIEILGHQNQNELIKLIQKAKAFVFAAEEDFGITIVEAQSCGTPVIAYKIGGASETVIDGKTGILFSEQTAESVIQAVKNFENASLSAPDLISRHALNFSRKTFEQNISNFIQEKFSVFKR